MIQRSVRLKKSSSKPVLIGCNGVRRKIANDNPIAIEFTRAGETQLALLDGLENAKAYEYAVFYHYCDRADCENNTENWVG